MLSIKWKTNSFGEKTTKKGHFGQSWWWGEKYITNKEMGHN